MAGTNPFARMAAHPELSTLNDPPVLLRDRETLAIPHFFLSLAAYLSGRISQNAFNTNTACTADDWATDTPGPQGDLNRVQIAYLNYTDADPNEERRQRLRFLAWLQRVLSEAQWDMRNTDHPEGRIYPSLNSVQGVVDEAVALANWELGI